jgi:hypothetical protein
VIIRTAGGRGGPLDTRSGGASCFAVAADAAAGGGGGFRWSVTDDDGVST